MNNKMFIVMTIVGSFTIVFGAYLFVARDSGKSKTLVASYNSTDKKRPQAEVKYTVKDLGTMKVSEKKSANFTLKNVGQKTLQLSNITSSCNCTVGQIIRDGKESKEYGMHSQSDEVFEVAPGKQVTVRVTYRPFVMPVYGLVEREVFIETNDPKNVRLIFQIKANVK